MQLMDVTAEPRVAFSAIACWFGRRVVRQKKWGDKGREADFLPRNCFFLKWRKLDGRPLGGVRRIKRYSVELLMTGEGESNRSGEDQTAVAFWIEIRHSRT
jgi:hypothetical protein